MLGHHWSLANVRSPLVHTFTAYFFCRNENST